MDALFSQAAGYVAPAWTRGLRRSSPPGPVRVVRGVHRPGTQSRPVGEAKCVLPFRRVAPSGPGFELGADVIKTAISR